MGRGPPGGPPGPPRGMMVGGGPKEPWGHGGHSRGGGGWGEEPISKGGWGDDPMKRDPSNWGGPGGGPGGDSQWGKPPRNMMQGGIRSSPSWDDPGALDGPPGGGGWKQAEMAKQKEMIWNSKSFKILCDMGYRKEDIEYALRVCNLRMEDAMEMLNQNGPAGRRMPGPQHDNMPFGAGGDNPMDPRGPHFPGYPHDPGAAQPGMPGGGLPMNSQMAQRMAGVGNPAAGMGPANVLPPHRQQQPQQQQPSQPSAQQLRILVHQIQMAVQAGHLNPQILNQPLAPQTLLLLNQLLQQIKQLQNLQQQHQMAARTNANSPALMGVTVNITKTKQHIQNLQNQISAQQANYMKNQLAQPGAGAPQGAGGAGGVPQLPTASDNAGGVGGGSTSTVQEMFNGLNLMGEAAAASNGSRLNQWKLPNSKELGKPAGAGGVGGGVTNKSGPQQQSSATGNLLLGGEGPWGKNSDGGSGGGWPESNKSASSNDDNFGIPEFEPGKPWRGTGLKNPDDDPNLTPGSVAALSIGLSKAISNSNLATATSESGGPGNALGLTSPTWSLGGGGPKPDAGAGPGQSKTPEGGAPAGAGNWPGKSAVVTTTSSLTSQIGQDLWGGKTPASTAAASGRPVPPGLAQPSASTPTSSGGWPATSAAAGAANGWSTNSGTGGDAPGGAGGGGSAWLILKNLTPQIDGSTLKTLCMQHGPLQHFDLYLNHSIALVMYASAREAAKVRSWWTVRMRISTLDVLALAMHIVSFFSSGPEGPQQLPLGQHHYPRQHHERGRGHRHSAATGRQPGRRQRRQQRRTGRRRLHAHSRQHALRQLAHAQDVRGRLGRQRRRRRPRGHQRLRRRLRGWRRRAALHRRRRLGRPGEQRPPPASARRPALKREFRPSTAPWVIVRFKRRPTGPFSMTTTTPPLPPSRLWELGRSERGGDGVRSLKNDI